MTTIINNGIISNGNNNTNIISQNTNICYSAIKEEINILVKYTNENLNDLKTACEKENPSLLIRGLRNLKKETIDLIKKLGLEVLENFLRNLF